MKEMWQDLTRSDFFGDLVWMLQSIVISALVTTALMGVAIYFLPIFQMNFVYLILAPFPGFVGAVAMTFVRFFGDKRSIWTYLLFWLLGVAVAVGFLVLMMFYW